MVTGNKETLIMTSLEDASSSLSEHSPATSSIAKILTNGSNFRVPDVPKKKRKKKILDEETYVHEVGKIIERDFFPDLENLNDKVAFLAARENNDIGVLQSLHRKYSSGNRLRTPGSVQDSPATFETPEVKSGKANRSENDSPSKSDDIMSVTSETSTNKVESNNISLDTFMNKNTSEDDDSFETILEEQKQHLVSAKPWLYGAEAIHNKVHAPDLSMKALPANEHEARQLEKEEAAKPKKVENWTYKTFNAVMYVPEGHHPSKERLLELAQKPTKKIIHKNTRFQENPFVKPLNQATVMEATAVQAYKQEGKVGVDGRELNRQETPNVRGYSFMGEASPAPGVEESPLITWGEVEGTPFQLDNGSTPLIMSHNSYSIPKESYREQIGFKLAEKASQSLKEKKSAISAAKSSLLTPNVNKWSTEKISTMSPAAKKLLTAGGFGIRQSSDHHLRASYTPSSRRTFTPSPFKTKTPQSVTRKRGLLTPSPIVKRSKTDSSAVSKSGQTSTSSLTDGLLKLPQRNEQSDSSVKLMTNRNCAADFF